MAHRNSKQDNRGRRQDAPEKPSPDTQAADVAPEPREAAESAEVRDKAADTDSTESTANELGGERRARCRRVDDVPDDCRGRKLHSTDWLEDIPGGLARSEYVEVQFKNTRKGYYRNCTNLPLVIGDMVAVEAAPGHDIGRVSLTGALAELRMRRSMGRSAASSEVRRVFRKAKPADLEKYEEARAREDDTMIRARRIAESLQLNMKIGDVEYQGDGNKAIFYYIADERVDFRQLIKVLAETFKVRIEMKQIGARQEAGRIGGIGPCGRPLCCSLWMTNFVSVATSAARYQDISLNPQKLAGQCAKLKCCLNFEVDAYVEASRKMPPRDAVLETADSSYYHFKSDIFNRLVTYSTDRSLAANLVTISADRVFEVIALNKAGEKPLSLTPDAEQKPKTRPEFGDILGEDDDLARFDKKKKKKKKSSGQKQPQPSADGQKKPQQGSDDRKKARPDGAKPQGEQRPPKPKQRPARPAQEGVAEGGGAAQTPKGQTPEGAPQRKKKNRPRPQGPKPE